MRHDDDGVLTVAFCEPSRLNAVTRDTLHELRRLLDQPCRALVLTGTGRAFSAGQDLEELSRLTEDAAWDAAEHLSLFQELTERLLSHPSPTVAALNGVAVGFGAEIALACDVRIAADSARMGFVEVARGLFQTNGVTWLLPRLVGHGRAADLLLTGDVVGADTLERWGLVTRRCADGELPDAAHAVALRLAAAHPLSRQLVREALDVTWSQTLPAMMQREVEGMQQCLASGAAAEGARAFVGSR